MKSTTEITLLPLDTVTDRQESGLIVPMQEGTGLQVVDCGDDRSLTTNYNNLRISGYGETVFPGRYFGGASGVALSALIALATQNGERSMQSFIAEFSAEGFTDFATDLTNKATKRSGVELNQHSAEDNEENDLTIGDHKSCEKGLGCAFVANLGAVLHGADQEWQSSEARRIQAEVGTDLPIEAAIEGVRILQKNITESFGIHRGALHHAQTRSGRILPIAMHEGHHAPNAETALVVDMAGWRSNANRHNDAKLPRYHHSVNLASELLGKIFPEGKLDSSVTAAASLLLATSTRFALSADKPDGLRVELIPQEYSVAA